MKRTSFQAFDGVLIGVVFLAMAAGTAVGLSCTPQDRATARTVIDTAAPVLCPLLARLNGDAGLVCKDVQPALDAVLSIAKADTRPTFEAVAGVGAAACTPLMLHDVDPTRDPREYVCRERVSEADVRRALGVGHAR